MHKASRYLPQLLSWVRGCILGGLAVGAVSAQLAAGAVSAQLVVGAVSAQAAEIKDLGTNFGSNPGRLQMFSYVPDSLPASAPLVVVLHGCTQNARDYAQGAGWLKMADNMGFALAMAQENDPGQHGCFKWFLPSDNQREHGEALSIKQMVDKMKADHGIDPKRVFVTGLSGGGAMTSVMLATYPDVFAGGGIIAGLPYGCAHNQGEAFSCMILGGPTGGMFNVTVANGAAASVPLPAGVCLMFPNLCPPSGNASITASQWGDFVRQACNCTGPFPIVSIWSGTGDTTVAPINATHEAAQWTNLHGVSQNPSVKDDVKGYPHQVFTDSTGKAVVETFSITGMPHGTPIDPGPGADQCGTATDQYIKDENICSSFHIAKFWGLSAPSTARRNNGVR